MLLSIFKTIKDNYYLIATWTRFNIESNYIDAKLGLIWLILEPILQTITYSYIFSALLGRNPRGDVPFIVFYLSGITTWQFLNTSWMRAGNLMVQFNRLMTNIKISPEAVIIIDLAERFVEFIINMILLVIVAAMFGFYPTYTYLFLPVIFLFMILTALGGMFFLGSLGVFVRDIPSITSMILRLMFFLSGVIITPDMLPEEYSKVLLVNPIIHLIEAMRDLTIYGTLPSLKSVLYMGSFSIVVFFFGYRYFKKRQNIFVDYQ